MSPDRATRADDTPAAAPDDDVGRSAERTSGQQASPVDGPAVRRAETRTREEYADAARADSGPMSRDTRPDNRETPEEEHRGQPEPRDHHDRAEPRDRETYADEVRGGHSASGKPDQAAEAPTLTDATPAQDQQGTGYQPETVTFENKDIEITHNAADGIWVEGLPGDPPTRIGDILTSPEDSGRSRLENLQQEAAKDADDLVDMGGKWTDLIRDTLGPPPPTHSMTGSHLPDITAMQPDHGINLGHGAEALLTVAIVGAAAVHKLHDRWERAWHH